MSYRSQKAPVTLCKLEGQAFSHYNAAYRLIN